jgi:CDP-paratose 2-epimerase
MGSIYTIGGGPANTMSLAQLTAWCNERFGRHEPGVEPAPRLYDIPWVAMDNCEVARDFGWRVETPLVAILEEIAVHAENHPDWLEISLA